MPDAMDPMPDFLALIEGRPAAEVEHALAVAAAVAHHMDQQKEHQMAKAIAGFNSPAAKEQRSTNDRSQDELQAESWSKSRYAADRTAAGRDRAIDPDSLPGDVTGRR